MRTQTLLVLATCLLAASCVVLATQPQLQTYPLTVSSISGLFTGVYQNQTRAFLGVPYAQAPVGNLRFRPPQPIWYNWGMTYATQNPPSCYQSGLPATYNMSEDCLYMNIFTPKYVSQDDDQFFSRLPVMVFIHGGRYWTGAATDFDGSLIAPVGDVISVVIQYRLNIFGFQSFDSNTNLGLQDQQAALSWIQKNIRAFGGDPNRVTIYGESAGGSSVLHHLTIPQSYHLYDRAIIQSSWQWYIPTATTSRDKTVAYAATKGCNITNSNGTPNVNGVLECMRALPARNITPSAAQSDFFVPMVDGRLIDTLPLTALKNGQYNKHAEVIIGHNYDEGNFMAYSRLGFVGPTANVTETKLNDTIAKYLKVYFAQSDVDNILSWYVPSVASSNWYGGAEFFGDYYITCGSILATEYFNRDNINFNSYIFNYSSPNYPASQPYLAASHGNELPYIFFRDVYTPYPFSTGDYFMASRMNRAWTDFAANGSPVSYLSQWPSTYPNAMYYGPDPTDLDAQVPYLKTICENWRPYFLAY
ncbi:hypothetical protein SAMD00019534_032780 [Acytostelium subglobosum LB1]|uniref:hypothetical protein n=1 Tax=Acytostelium subglobosum LB1 TaxID=1410327 RepID=UPI000644BFB1|nr:hypothetical protein SAMD00019534_032780 [Acytostelium subglobosum LB1]GAM20103.1 hypothetical protein SAMD00019534_032780 [Acytostelium subglobosum LB1]|eukprot:XP_012756865.1 hypothetical protein SAMD00019534_032780 [Acytostelium subglobosum LB1]